jgi:hypothetical protein
VPADEPRNDAAALGRARSAWIRAHLQQRPYWWEEIVLIGACLWVYTVVQDNSPLRVSEAFTRGRDLLRFEDRLHIALERPLNSWQPHVHPLAVLTNYYYLGLHFLVPGCVLLWLYLRRPDQYRSTRRILLFATLISLVFFWALPTAPPRLLGNEGFIDTLTKYHAIGGYESGPTAHANQFAAFPSDHLAFACWVAFTMFRNAAHRAVRFGWLLYPCLTAYAVMATANHYFLDVVAGVATFGLALAISTAITAIGRRQAAAPSRPAPARAPSR